MIKVTDTITGDELEYEGIEDFVEAAKHSFDESVHDAIDKLAEALVKGEPTQGYEQYLGIVIR